MDNEIAKERYRLSARGEAAMDAPDERVVCTMTDGEMLEADGCAKRNIAPLSMDAAAPNAKSMGKSHKIDRQ